MIFLGSEDIWEKVFWKKLKGTPIAQPLTITAHFPLKSVSKTYSNLVNSDYMENVLRGSCKIGTQIGDVYNLSSGKFNGRIVTLSPHEIVIKLGCIYNDRRCLLIHTLNFLKITIPHFGLYWKKRQAKDAS